MDHRSALEEIGRQALTVLRSSRLRPPGIPPRGAAGLRRRTADGGPAHTPLPRLMVPVPLVARSKP
ncbi:hypothetical protein [Gordonia sp. VNK21]|uniref:hypothetical protein n=1 Tax=Gordonia sp. VNK21 TaxID=3382483 RepID=UPI0038D3C7C9